MKKGLLVSFEGIDGAGKTTQFKMLYSYLTSIDLKVVAVREPGGTKIGEKIRAMLLDRENAEMSIYTEMLLYAAARAQLVSEIIKPALNRGSIVLCDRFIDSSLVYQGVARKIGIDNVYMVNKIALQGVLPDITFFIDIKPDVGLKRIGDNGDRLENESIKFHYDVYRGYKEILHRFSGRIIRLDGNRDKDVIHYDIKTKLNEIVKKKGGMLNETGYCDSTR